jgi:Flp pilus assembly protein TadG
MLSRVRATGGMTLGHRRQDERMMAPTAGPGACSRVGRPAWAVVVESVPEHRLSSVDRAHRRPSVRLRDDAHGQSLVEFALVLVPLFILLLGIIQFGFIFNTYVTMTNAAREGARTGTIYVYDRTHSKDENDRARNEAIRTALLSSMNFLGKTTPQFANGSTWSGGPTYTNGDLTVTYLVPTGVVDSDARTGEQVTVRAGYHQDLIVPLISAFLPKDSGGRMVLTGEVTMVIN